MVVSNASLYDMPWLAVLRNFLVCFRIFLGITIERGVYTPACLKKSLYFRHMIFRYKLMTYFAKFQDMVNTHKLILNFRKSCRSLHHVLKPIARKVYAPSLKLSFFSRPFRPLP